jgi:hypothetical protein
MNDITTTAKKLPRATAKEKDGIVMYWLDELQEGGLHINGIARLLGCNPNSVSQYMSAVIGLTTIEAEIVTDKGVRVVMLVLGGEFQKLLRHITRSRASASLRDRADDIRDKLAASGFKLAVMLELAPQKLAAQVQNQIDKEIRLQELKLETAKIVGDLTVLHGKELAMTAIGAADQVIRVETVVTEVVEPATGRYDKILSSDQLKRAIANRTGQKIKSMKEVVDRIKAAGRDDLLLPVTRHSTTEYVNADRLDEALALIYGESKQELLKPAGLLSRKKVG